MPIPETFDFLISNDLVGLQLSDDLNADPWKMLIPKIQIQVSQRYYQRQHDLTDNVHSSP
jgi:hypothetical protein